MGVGSACMSSKRKPWCRANYLASAIPSSGKVNKPPQIPTGMAVTAEIKTGKRRSIEYFLSPLLQYGNESLRER